MQWSVAIVAIVCIEAWLVNNAEESLRAGGSGEEDVCKEKVGAWFILVVHVFVLELKDELFLSFGYCRCQQVEVKI